MDGCSDSVFGGDAEVRAAVARFWPRPPSMRVPPPEKLVGRLGSSPRERAALAASVVSGFAAFLCGNYPTAGNVAAAKEWNPAAGPLLDRWLDAWTRSFPEGLPPRLGNHRNEGDQAHAAGRRQNRLGWARSEFEAGRATNSASYAHDLATGVFRHAPHGARDWRAHVVDDAEAVDSLRHASPGDVLLRIGDATLVLDGHRDDGSPILAVLPEEEAKRLGGILRKLQSPQDVEYWRSTAFLDAVGREVAVCVTEDECLVTLLAMALDGHRKAFLKGVVAKSGTWTVDLSGIASPGDAFCAMARAGIRWSKVSPGRRGIIVQEHVPFRCEQRFFVIGGRIVASVCSDREHSAADSRRDRILDERVACLSVPEVSSGEYDRGVARSRVDRGLSAAFARAARQVVRRMRGEVPQDYTLDMGLSDRGILPIELNQIYRSGPYSLSHKRIVDARARIAGKARAEFGAYVSMWVKREGEAGPAELGRAAAGLSLRAIAAAVSGDIHHSEAGVRFPPFRNSFQDFVRDLAAATAGREEPLGDLAPDPAVDVADAMAFALMREFTPAGAVSMLGFELADLGFGDGRFAERRDCVRLCVGTRPTTDGAVVGLAVALRRGSGAAVTPLEPAWGASDGPFEDTVRVCRDGWGNTVLLRRSSAGWELAYELLDGRSVSRPLPQLAVARDGHPLLHSWDFGGVVAAPVEVPLAYGELGDRRDGM